MDLCKIHASTYPYIPAKNHCELQGKTPMNEILQTVYGFAVLSLRICSVESTVLQWLF